MEGLLNFLKNYYVIFIILSVLLIFALIGYIVDKKKKESKVYEAASESKGLNDVNIDTNVYLQDAVNKNINMNSNINMNNTGSNEHSKK